MAEGRLFSADDFRVRAKTRLSAGASFKVGDHGLNPGFWSAEREAALKPAAVLVPVVRREPEATLLLTERTAGLRTHSGQVAFPGGRIDPDDGGPVDAALREAEEEIGLSREFVETLCVGPDYLTGSGYRVAPVLAVVSPGFTLQLNPAEVADAFEVPLSFLMDPANHRTGSRIWQGITRNFYEMPYRDRHIWGATAGILRVLYERLYADLHVEAAG